MKRWMLTALFPVVVVSTGLGQTAWELGDRYVREALEAGPEMQAERQRINLARQQVREAFGAMLPTVDVQSRYTRAEGGREIRFDVNDFLPPSVLPQDVPPSVIPFLREEEQETRISFRQTLFTGGGLYHSWRSRKQSRLAEEAAVRSEEVAVAYRTREAWFNWLSARDMVQVAVEDTLLAAEQLRAARLRGEQGMANPAEVQRARASLANARSRWIDADTGEQLARTALNRLLGRDLLTLPDVPVPSDELPPSAHPLDTLLAASLGTRGELQQLDRQGEALEHARKATDSAWWPTLVAAGEYGYQGEDYEFSDEQDYYLLSGILQWNLFNGFQKNAQREQVVVQRRQLEQAQRNAQLAVRQDVTHAWLNDRGSRAKHRAALEAQQAAEENYRMVRAMYDEGMTRQVELLDAQITRTQAATQEIAARYAVWIARADLQRSVGRVFEDQPSNREPDND
ncbi:hypothetical protein GF324_13610 [bacterium]|nr:hypothetical protein [bacterium]